MKNRLGIFVVMIAAMAFVSCEPIEKRNEMKGSVSEAEITQYVVITQDVIDGKRSNWVTVSSEGLKALTSFEYGLGKYVGTKERVMLSVVPTENSIVKVNILNRDGSKTSKEFSFTVDECFDVDPAWAYLCGTGEKLWTWDEDADPDCYGMGSAWDDAPGWWVPAWGADVDELEWHGATMSFAADGAVLTKFKTDGSTEKGFFSFKMYDEDHPNAEFDISLGDFNTRDITVLLGKSWSENGDDWDADVYNYDILELNDDELVLIHRGPDWDGDQCTFWIFKAVDD
jgi:hypothetical protein